MDTLDDSRMQAEKELAKAKQYFDASLKKVSEYVKKNPKQATAVSAGIGVALGTALTLLTGSKKPNSKKKK